MTRRGRALPLLLAPCLLIQPATAQDCTPDTWIRAEPQPTPRSRHTMAFDSARGKVLLFGGEVSGPEAPDMWEWDGAVPGRGTWLRRPTSPTPLPYISIYDCMAFDAARNRAVYFDRWKQTWEWDSASATWSHLAPTVTPHGRALASMAFDTDRGRILLYGGANSSWWPNDLWEWDGSEWTLVTHSPLGSQPYVLMTYDAHRRRVLIFDPLNRKVWEYDPELASWTQRFPAMTPTPRREGSLTFDPTTGHTFFFGGASAVSNNDLWEWDGDAGEWTERALSGPPPARYAARLVADTARRRMVLFGGTAGTLKFDDLWEFEPVTGTQWLQRIAVSTPPPRTNHGLVFDDARREMVLFGGASVSSSAFIPLGDTWIRPSEGPNAGSWILQSTALFPSSRFVPGMAYNGSTRRALLFGGLASSTPKGDTWEWDSDSRQWMPLQPAISPDPRYVPAMAYDSIRADIVLFGGAKPNGLQEAQFDDTWKWRSAIATWTRILPPVSPPARGGAAMAYDTSRDRVILFGGFSGSFGTEARSDTWEYNPGTETWTQLFPEQTPPTGNGYPIAMAYNQDRSTMLLRCGTASTPATWEWNGFTWAPLEPTNVPTEHTPSALAFDSARRTFLHFGGRIGSEATQNTWEWTTADPPPILHQPQPLSIREGDTAAFAVSCPAATPPTYRWRRNGIPLTDDGRISGTLTPILHIKPTLLSDAGDYDVLVTGLCGIITSEAAALSTTCYANCDLSSLPAALSATDYLCFLDRFAASDPYANCDNSTATPTLNVNDFICFMNRFARGCN